MRVEINTYAAVVKSFTYLEQELEKNSLDKETAILYFQILLDEEENEVIERPHFTFIFEGFDKYLRFFKQYNFIESGINRNVFKLSKNWKDARELYIVSSSMEDSFLKMREQHEELSAYYRISA